MFTPLNMTAHHMQRDGAATVFADPDFGRALYMSVSTLMTLGIGDEVPMTGAGRILTGMEVAVGYLMLGGLLSRSWRTRWARLS